MVSGLAGDVEKVGAEAPITLLVAVGLMSKTRRLERGLAVVAQGEARLVEAHSSWVTCSAEVVVDKQTPACCPLMQVEQQQLGVSLLPGVRERRAGVGGGGRRSKTVSLALKEGHVVLVRVHDVLSLDLAVPPGPSCLLKKL